MAYRSAQAASVLVSTTPMQEDAWGPPMPVKTAQYETRVNQQITIYKQGADVELVDYTPVDYMEYKHERTNTSAFVHSPYPIAKKEEEATTVDLLRVRDAAMMPELVEKISNILGCKVKYGAKQTKSQKRKPQTTSIQRLTLDTNLSATEVISLLQKYRLVNGLAGLSFGDRAIEFQQTGTYTEASAAELAKGWRLNEFEHRFVSESGLCTPVRMVVVEILKTENEVQLPTVEELAALSHVDVSCCMALVSGGFCPCAQGPGDSRRKFCADAHTKVCGCTQYECRGYHEANMLRDVPDVLKFVHHQTKRIIKEGGRATQSCLVVTGHDFQPICAELFLTGWCEPKTRITPTTTMNCNFFHATLNVPPRCQPKSQPHRGYGQNHNHNNHCSNYNNHNNYNNHSHKPHFSSQQFSWQNERAGYHYVHEHGRYDSAHYQA